MNVQADPDRNGNLEDVGLPLRRVLIGATFLGLGLIVVVQSGSAHAGAGLVLGLIAGALIFRLAANSGRVLETPGAGWRDQWRINSSGPASVGAAVGIGIATFLSSALSVLAPQGEHVAGAAVLGAVAGLFLSLRFSRYGKTTVSM